MPPAKSSGANFHLAKRVRTPADAVQFLNRVGFCVLFPVKGVALPSLYYAASRRPLLTWDRYCMLIWKWKDELPRRKRAFYAKYFKGRGSFISLEMLPYFLAAEGSAAAVDDFLRYYEQGCISHDGRVIWEALATHGPMATLELRHAINMETKTGNVRFKKAMLELQRRLFVVHFGAEQETAAWASGRFELTARAFPKQVAAARAISPARARDAIASKYIALYHDVTPLQVARLFGWSKTDSISALNSCRTRVQA
jgi:hypothetical protein